RRRAAGLLAQVLDVDAVLDARRRGGLDQPGDLLQLLLRRGAGGEEPAQPEVLLAVDEDGERGLAVPPGTPDLLVVAVHGVGGLGVDDEAGVGLVRAPGEWGGGG